MQGESRNSTRVLSAQPAGKSTEAAVDPDRVKNTASGARLDGVAASQLIHRDIGGPPFPELDTSLPHRQRDDDNADSFAAHPLNGGRAAQTAAQRCARQRDQ